MKIEIRVFSRVIHRRKALAKPSQGQLAECTVLTTDDILLIMNFGNNAFTKLLPLKFLIEQTRKNKFKTDVDNTRV